MAALDRAAVGALYDPPLTAAAIKTRQKRYPPGHPNAYPAPLPEPVNGGPVWDESQIEELRAWKGAGRGKGGGRRRKATPPPADAHARAHGRTPTGGMSDAEQPDTLTSTKPGRVSASNVSRVIRAKVGMRTENRPTRDGVRCAQWDDRVRVRVSYDDDRYDAVGDAARIETALTEAGYAVERKPDDVAMIVSCRVAPVTVVGAEPIGDSAPPVRPINRRATADVFRNLQRPKDKRDPWGSAGETFDVSSFEIYRESAKRWLAENSELKHRTIESADWPEIYEYFRSQVKDADVPEAASVPTPTSDLAADLAARPISDDPDHAGMSLWEVINHENAKVRQERERLKAEARKRVTGDPNAADHANIHVDVVEPGSAVVVGPGFQARVGVVEGRKSRLYWIELSSSDTHPDDVEKVIGHARTYAAAGALLAQHHGLTNYTVDVDQEK